jgi:DNA polymerase (family 10)
MGGDRRIPLEAAQVIAEGAVHYLRPYCERIEIGGSIRRKKKTVGDIEIVAIPKVKKALDLFGQPTGEEELMISQGIDDANTREWFWLKTISMGHRYWKLANARNQNFPIDLFLVRPPAQWGPIFALRTGSADFSKRLMTALRARGYRSEDGRILDKKDNLIDCPEEQDVFEVAGMRWIVPESRG